MERTGRSGKRPGRAHIVGSWGWAAYAYIAVVVTSSVLAPIGVLLFWLTRALGEIDVGALLAAARDSVSVSLPAALVATGLAIPIALLERRYRSGLNQAMGRVVYLGYATPPLALALGFIFFVLRAAPWLYQTAALLVVVYTVHFLAQAVGPVRTSLFMATPRIEEASRSLGYNAMQTLRRVTYPLLRPGLIGAAALVFLSCVKELPVTFLLAPLNFQTLALKVYGYTTEAMFAEAAPHALSIVVLSAILVSVLFRHNVELRQ